MAEIKAVKDPKIGKPKPKSGVAVPYYDLTQSIEVARTVHEKGGGHCSRQQLAPLLKYSGTNNGGFLTRVTAAKTFGLIEEGETIRLTDRARTILAPVRPEDAERARVDAFLGVDFFKTFFERFDGVTLPQEAGLKNLLENTYSIVPGRIVPALRVLMDSADQAGFFKLTGNRSRMVKPIFANHDSSSERPAAEERKPPAEPEHAADHSRRHAHGGGRGGDGGGANIPPALAGLLSELPTVGTVLTGKRRKALTDAFASAIDFLYPEPEGNSIQ